MKGGRNSVHQQGFGAYTFINEAESEGFCEKCFCDFIISSQERRLFWGVSLGYVKVQNEVWLSYINPPYSQSKT